jgi:hypothetical protein
MKGINAFKILALVGVACFSANAAKHNVAKGGSISAAVTAAAAGDTVSIAADTFIDKFIINKKLTVMGAGKTSTVIKRAAKDSSATISITAKNVTIKNLTVYGHNAVADSADSNHCFPTSDAIIISGAESTSIASCIVVGGNGIAKSLYSAAMGGNAVVINKASKNIFITDDSLRGGNANMTRLLGDTVIDKEEDGSGGVPTALYRVGKSGNGVYVESSSLVTIDGCKSEGGDGTGFPTVGATTKGGPAVECFHSVRVKVANSTLYGGKTIFHQTYMVEGLHLIDTSIACTTKVSINSTSEEPCGDDCCEVDEGSFLADWTGVLFHDEPIAEKTGFFSIARGSDHSVSIGCYLIKESFVAIDLLTTKGQVVKKLRIGRAAAGQHRFALDLKGMNGPNGIYLIKVATRDNQQSFKVVSVR